MNRTHSLIPWMMLFSQRLGEDCLGYCYSVCYRYLHHQPCISGQWRWFLFCYHKTLALCLLPVSVEGQVKCRNANSIKGYEVPKAVAARVQMRDSPKSTQVCSASWYTMTGLFESHWCYFLANVSFIQNCFFTAYSPLKSCYKWELCS